MMHKPHISKMTYQCGDVTVWRINLRTALRLEGKQWYVLKRVIGDGPVREYERRIDEATAERIINAPDTVEIPE